MPATSNDQEVRRSVKLRRCRLYKWQNYNGLGFELSKESQPPHFINMIESNSPAAASGLRIHDTILSVNEHKVTKASYEKLKEIIERILSKNEPVDFLVTEKHQYERVKEMKISFDRKNAELIETPRNMPDEYANFQRNIPRTCNIRLDGQNPLLSFASVAGDCGMGAYVQDVASDPLLFAQDCVKVIALLNR